MEDGAEDATYLPIGHYPRLFHEPAKVFALGVITGRLIERLESCTQNVEMLFKLRR